MLRPASWQSRRSLRRSLERAGGSLGPPVFVSSHWLVLVKLSAQETEDVFNFVMSEIVRFAQMSIEEMKGLGLSDFLGPKVIGFDGRARTLGQAASQRLRELTERAIDDSAFRRRLDPKTAFDSVLKGYGTEYVRADRASSTAEEDRARLQNWIERAGENCKTLTHYVPCQIGMKGVGRVSLGPITFGPTEEAFERLALPFENSRAAADAESARRKDMLAEKCAAYLEAFSDVAEVTVPDCDEVTSQRIADEAVQAALSSLHLLAGAYPTKAMRGGGPAMTAVETASIAVDSDEVAVLRWSKTWEGASIHSAFWGSLSKPPRVQMVDAIGVAIATIINRTDAEFVAARFLDAVAWYSDAVREKSLPAAIVKYLTAMERLLWTGEKGAGVTRRLAERTAALCFSADVWDYEQLADEVREAMICARALSTADFPHRTPR